MILIISSADDEHASHVEARLAERGQSYLRFNPSKFPLEAEIVVQYSAVGRSRSVLHVGSDEVDLTALRAVWYRRPTWPVIEQSRAHLREFLERECKNFMLGLFEALDCFWFPAAPAAEQRAGRKELQLRLAGDLGFELPPTLITNCPTELFDFYRQHDGNVVSKLVSSALHDVMGNEFVRFTEAVSTRDIVHAEGLRHCPMIFQAYVPKQIELRITVVGKRVFSAEIHSQVGNRTRRDWRRYNYGRTPHLPHVLPVEIERRCVALVERLGLWYGAIDMILTPEGRYVFVEINPNGQYLWIEQEVGMPISDAICDLLAGEEKLEMHDCMSGGVG